MARPVTLHAPAGDLFEADSSSEYDLQISEKLTDLSHPKLRDSASVPEIYDAVGAVMKLNGVRGGAALAIVNGSRLVYGQREIEIE